MKQIKEALCKVCEQEIDVFSSGSDIHIESPDFQRRMQKLTGDAHGQRSARIHPLSAVAQHKDAERAFSPFRSFAAKAMEIAVVASLAAACGFAGHMLHELHIASEQSSAVMCEPEHIRTTEIAVPEDLSLRDEPYVTETENVRIRIDRHRRFSVSAENLSSSEAFFTLSADITGSGTVPDRSYSASQVITGSASGRSTAMSTDILALSGLGGDFEKIVYTVERHSGTDADSPIAERIIITEQPEEKP